MIGIEGMQPAIALLEFDSIAIGVRAGDAMVKRAPVEITYAGTVHPGKYLVLVGVCTHLGCAPLEDFQPRPVEGWDGGFFCPCHGSKFDLAGRVFKGVPAPTNLRVPPYRFVRDDLILIGQDSGVA